VTVRVILFKSDSKADVRALSARLSNEDIPFFLGGESDSKVVLVTGDPTDQSNFVTSLVLEEAGPGVAVGESRPTRLEGLPTAVMEADYAAKVAYSRGATVLRFNEIGIQTMLLSGQSNEQLRALAESVLQPVLDLGEPLAQRLLNALSAFLHNNGHWGAAAAAAGIHRHTLRKQVEQVEELTGRSVSDANERNDLFLATTALELSSLRVTRAARVRRGPSGTPRISAS
jgi:purine catabolism regulator